MTNRCVVRKYFSGLWARLRASKDPNDQELCKYLLKKFQRLVGIDERIRQMGECPLIHWQHNIQPRALKEMVREANKKKREPGYARKIILRYVEI